jgi:hypothetical protein
MHALSSLTITDHLQWNTTQRALIQHTSLAIMDESMIGWRPKTSKFGGLPNYTWEPRKPVPLGTMLRDTAEGVTGVMLHVDPVMLAEVQGRKLFSRELTQMPNADAGAFHQAHVAEVLRQTKNAGVKKGGWIGGDAWFGSVAACMSLKNNTALYPKKPLLSVLRARHGELTAGHWVVFKAEFQGVPLIAMVYGWSNTGVAYFISTVGNTHAHDLPYRSYFEDPYGGTGTREVPRPVLAHFIYQFLPMIDEHNKQRQALLDVEGKWPTHSCWFKLLAGFVGMSAVNMQRIYIYRFPNVKGKDLPICQFVDKIAGGLQLRVRRILPRRLRNEATDVSIKRKGDELGEKRTKKLTRKQQEQGRNVGSSMQATCFICKKYCAAYKWTTFVCRNCGTALCQVDRSTDEGRYTSCIAEHENSLDHRLFCSGTKRTTFPKDAKV